MNLGSLMRSRALVFRSLVSPWWDALWLGGRLAVARQVYPNTWAQIDWRPDWEALSIGSQRLVAAMYWIAW